MVPKLSVDFRCVCRTLTRQCRWGGKNKFRIADIDGSLASLYLGLGILGYSTIYLARPIYRFQSSAECGDGALNAGFSRSKSAISFQYRCDDSIILSRTAQRTGDMIDPRRPARFGGASEVAKVSRLAPMLLIDRTLQRQSQPSLLD